MRWAPAQELGPPNGRHIGPGVASAYTKRNIKLVSFAGLEPTTEALTDWLDPAPPWMAGYRGGNGYTIEQQEERRQEIIRNRSDIYPHRAVDRSRRVKS